MKYIKLFENKAEYQIGDLILFNLKRNNIRNAANWIVTQTVESDTTLGIWEEVYAKILGIKRVNWGNYNYGNNLVGHKKKPIYEILTEEGDILYSCELYIIKKLDFEALINSKKYNL